MQMTIKEAFVASDCGMCKITKNGKSNILTVSSNGRIRRIGFHDERLSTIIQSYANKEIIDLKELGNKIVLEGWNAIPLFR